MSKMTWVKWGCVVSGATLVALNLGACFADFVMQMLVLDMVN